jgi:hypothetical protein
MHTRACARAHTHTHTQNVTALDTLPSKRILLLKEKCIKTHSLFFTIYSVDPTENSGCGIKVNLLYYDFISTALLCLIKWDSVMISI